MPHALPGTGWAGAGGAPGRAEGRGGPPGRASLRAARQVYYSLWRKLLRAFWWLVVAYTMLVLCAVYTFQFQDFPAYWRNLTGLTDEQWVAGAAGGQAGLSRWAGGTPRPRLTAALPARLGDLGLEQFSVSELFSSILVPGFFLLACILQLHYFHQPFMRLTDLGRAPPPAAQPPRRARGCANPPQPAPLLPQPPVWARGGGSPGAATCPASPHPPTQRRASSSAPHPPGREGG